MKYYSRYLTQPKKYSDLSGKFLIPSDRRNNYILVAYHYDVNNILTKQLNNRTLPCIINGITKVYEELRNKGLTPKFHIMDNEVSKNLKQYFEDSDIQFQLVPPHMHSDKFCRKICEKIQEPLYSRPMYCGTFLLFIVMGPPLTPSHHETNNNAVIPTKP